MSQRQRFVRPIAQTNPRSPITEAYRTVRTNIQFANVIQDTKVVLVTSTQTEEGKTSTVTNLAVVSAQAGKRVLLIDADLRKPQVHNRFQLSNIDGLSSTMIRERSLEESIARTNVENLFVLPSGPIPPNPSEILSSEAFYDLIQHCKIHFDMVLIDSPPVLAVADALVISRSVDGVVYVVDSQKTNRNHAQKGLQALQQVQARILGVVLNKVSKKSSDNYYYYYGAQDIQRSM